MNIETIREEQRRFFQSGATGSFDFRRKMLLALLESIKREEQNLLDALAADLGKSAEEAYTNEVGFIYTEIRYVLKKLKKWMKTGKFLPEVYLLPGVAKIVKEPYGSVLLISPWNYPFQLLFAPLVEALAAGNCAVAKPSEIASRTALVSQRIIEAAFAPEYVAVVQGGADTVRALIDQDFDYLFFTGSVPVGRKIMEAASRHLTPLTLELGGKSPAFVDASADIPVAARRIAYGKFNNAGQTCVAPDYVLVDHPVEADFLEALKQAIREFYSDNPAKSAQYGRIISDRHFDRLHTMLDGASVCFGGESDRSTRYIGPTLIHPVSWKDTVMHEEIFGPLLPVLSYQSLDQAIHQVRQLPKPLALYVFARNKAVVEKITGSVPFGGGGVNTTLMHVASHKLPFGGVGSSGMGSYHGKAGFDTFSHAKGMLHQCASFDPGFAYPHKVPALDKLKKVIR
jgi:aldehyde dehydrogenase (NAD+)